MKYGGRCCPRISFLKKGDATPPILKAQADAIWISNSERRGRRILKFR